MAMNLGCAWTNSSGMKGMRKISRGRGFRGCFCYVFGDERPKFLGASNCVMGRTQDELVREFGFAHSLRADCKKPVWHQALRLKDSEVVSHERQLEFAHEYMKRMGFDGSLNQYAVIAHGDGHVHIVASRVGLDGKLWLGRNENLISTRIVGNIEREFGLQVSNGPEYVESFDALTGEAKHHIKKRLSTEKVRRPGRREEMRHARLHAAGKAPEQSPRQHIVAALTEAHQVGKKEGLAAFLRTAESRGVEVRTILGARLSQRQLIAAAAAFAAAVSNALTGIVFRAFGREFSGSRLGGGFSAPKLSAELKVGQGKHDQALILEREQPFGDARQITPIPQPPAPRKGRQYGYQPTYTSPRGNADLASGRAAAAGAGRSLAGVDSVNRVRTLSSRPLVRNRVPDGAKNVDAADLLLPGHERKHVVSGRPQPADGLRRAPHAAPAARYGRPALGGSILAWLEPDGEVDAMTNPSISNPSLGGGIFGRNVFQPAPVPAAESPPPPPPPPPPAPAMRPQFELDYEAEVQSVQRRGRHLWGEEHYRQHKIVVDALAAARAKRDLAEDAAYPGRRKRREASEAAMMGRIDAALAYKPKSINAQPDSEGAYLQAAAGWITSYRANNGREPAREDWRTFDREKGVRALMKGQIPNPDKVAALLTKLSGGAVRTFAELEDQAANRRPEELLIANWGEERFNEVQADIRKPEREAAGLKSSSGNRRKGPRP